MGKSESNMLNTRCEHKSFSTLARSSCHEDSTVLGTYDVTEGGFRVLLFDTGTVGLGVEEEGAHGALGLVGVLQDELEQGGDLVTCGGCLPSD